MRKVCILLFCSQVIPALIRFCSCLLSLKLIDFVVYLSLFIPNAAVFGVLGYKFLIGSSGAREWLRGLIVSSIISVTAICFFAPNAVLTYDTNGLCNMLMFILFSIATQRLGHRQIQRYGISKRYHLRFMHDLALLYVNPRVLTGYKYTTDEVVKTLKLLSPRTTNMSLVRIGNAADGGYILLEELIKQNGITYSLGVGDSTQFEEEMTEKYNHTNYMYDHTVSCEHIPKTKNFVFQPKGVGSENTEQLKTLTTMIRDNGHQDEQEMILQCDIEGSEWEIFQNTSQETLKQFSQIIIEFHCLDRCIMDLNFFEWGTEHWRYTRMKETLSILRQNFTPFHVHGNNYRDVFIFEGVSVPIVLEVSYVRNDLVQFTNEQKRFPTLLDKANHKGVPDHQLGRFQWT